MAWLVSSEPPIEKQLLIDHAVVSAIANTVFDATSPKAADAKRGPTNP